MSNKMNKGQKPENKDVDMSQENDATASEVKEEATSADNMADAEHNETDNSAQLTAEIAEWKDKYVRLSAEFDNYRKRTLKEKLELMQTGGEDVVKAILVVLDDFERALKAMETAEDVAAVKEGVLLIAQKFRDTLRSKKVEEIDAMGKELDTDFHEAIAKIPADENNKGKIVDVIQKGYTMGGKVIRHSKVVVGD